MSGRIIGISRSSLWQAWKEIRVLLRNSSVRDVIDFLEYDIDPNVWINRLLRHIRDGTYEPTLPHRFTLGKGKGFSRVMTLPAIPDLVLYRTIVDYLYRRIRHREHKHVYFERRILSKVVKAAASAAQQQMQQSRGSPYAMTSTSRFLTWLRYDQYRKYLVLRRIYPYIVITDITNFFDNVLYSGVIESLHGIGASPRMVGLLFFLLERLSVRPDYSESPRIGLPVDEFDCSRKLAHILLFPHDDRIVAHVGDEAYVRWMDDQNLGVASRAEGLKALSAVGGSLSRLYLTAHAGKSKVLALREARRHFHLDINVLLDEADAMPVKTRKQRSALTRKVNQIWDRARNYEGEGEWDKILKRIYRLAGLARSRRFRRRATADILKYPDLARRISEYMRCSGGVMEYLAFIRLTWSHDEQLYPDVNLILTESLLRLEAKGIETARIRKLASNLLGGKPKILGHEGCAAVAPLILLRFGDRRSLPRLRSCFEKRLDSLPSAVIRAASIVYASYGMEEFRVVRKTAARLLRNPIADMIRLIERVRAYEEVPGSYKARLSIRFDSVGNHQYIDMRSVLAARLLVLNRRAKVRDWLRSKKREFLGSSISPYDKGVVNPLLN